MNGMSGAFQRNQPPVRNARGEIRQLVLRNEAGGTTTDDQYRDVDTRQLVPPCRIRCIQLADDLHQQATVKGQVRRNRPWLGQARSAPVTDGE